MLTINTAPTKTRTGTIATLDELKHQLNIPVEFTDDNTILTDLLSVAVEAVEEDTKSDIRDVSNVLVYDLTSEGAATSVPSLIYINQAPARAVSKIEILNAGIWSTIAATGYRVDIAFTRFEINLFDSYTAEQIRFTFTTGYADAARPKQLKQAVILKAADLFGPERSNYSVTAITNNLTYARLINKHVRTYW